MTKNVQVGKIVPFLPHLSLKFLHNPTPKNPG
jgi:hypothetical protein